MDTIISYVQLLATIAFIGFAFGYTIATRKLPYGSKLAALRLWIVSGVWFKPFLLLVIAAVPLSLGLARHENGGLALWMIPLSALYPWMCKVLLELKVNRAMKLCEKIMNLQGDAFILACTTSVDYRIALAERLQKSLSRSDRLVLGELTDRFLLDVSVRVNADRESAVGLVQQESRLAVIRRIIR